MYSLYFQYAAFCFNFNVYPTCKIKAFKITKVAQHHVCANTRSDLFCSATLRERESQKIELLIRHRPLFLTIKSDCYYLVYDASQPILSQDVTSCLCGVCTMCVNGACTVVGCLLPRRCFTTWMDSCFRLRGSCIFGDGEDGGGRLLVDSPWPAELLSH